MFFIYLSPSSSYRALKTPVIGLKQITTSLENKNEILRSNYDIARK